MDFRKAFDSVPRHRLMDFLWILGIPDIGLIAILTLYETLSSQVHTLEGLIDNLLSMIVVKQGCPLSLTPFYLYIDELESYILETCDPDVGFLLHDSSIPIILFPDDIVLLSHSVEGLQILIHALNSFSDRQELQVNLSKIKVMVFNASKVTLD